MIRRPPRSTQSRSSAASDVYKRQLEQIERRVCLDCPGRRHQGFARGHRSNRAGLPAGGPVAAAPGAIGAVVPAEPRLSPDTRGAASFRAVTACLLTAAVVEIIRLASVDRAVALTASGFRGGDREKRPPEDRSERILGSPRATQIRTSERRIPAEWFSP